MKLIFETDWQAMQWPNRLLVHCKVIILSLSLGQGSIKEDFM
jgi:hypothetical protein